jgi:membrane protein
MLPDVPRGAMSGSAPFSRGIVQLGKIGDRRCLGSGGIASSFGTAGSIIALSLRVYYAASISFMDAEFARQPTS